MMSKNFVTSVTAATLALSVSACKMVRNIDETHDATVAMHGTTQAMAQTTATMSKTTGELLGATGTMHRDSREVVLKNLRSDSLKRMVEAETMDKKIDESEAYQESFEFQKWNPKMETPLERGALFAQAASEYVHEAREMLRTHVSQMDDKKVSGTKRDDESKNLYAFVAAMHELNDDQKAMALQGLIMPVSMFEILGNGLRENHEVAQGKRHYTELSPSAVVVGQAYQDVVYLMQIRMNVLAARPLSSISNISSEKLLGLAGRITGARMEFFPWKAKVEKLTVAQFHEFTDQINQSRRTRDLLISIGVTPDADEQIVKTYLKMKLDSESAKSVGPQNQDAVEGFKLALESLLGQKLRQ